MKHRFLLTPALILAIALAPALVRAETPATAKPAVDKEVKAPPTVKAPATEPAVEKDVKAEPVVKAPEPVEVAPALEEKAVAAKPTDPKTVLAKVDGQSITLGDVKNEFDQLKTMLKGQGMKPEQMEQMAEALQPQILDELITRQLVNGECTEQKIEINDTDVKDMMAMFVANLPNGMSKNDFFTKSGLTEDILQKEFREQSKLQKLLKIADPSEADMQAFYDENKDRFFHTADSVRASHILIKVEEGDSAKVKANKKALAELIREQLLAGADFEAVAQDFSDCPSGQRGGDLGPFKRGMMVKPFEQAAYSQEIDEIGPVVETDFGYHIIVVKEKTLEKTIQFAEAKTRIPQMLKAKTVMDKMPEYVASLKEKAKIEYLNGAEPPKPMNPFMGAPGGEGAPGAE